MHESIPENRVLRDLQWAWESADLLAESCCPRAAAPRLPAVDPATLRRDMATSLEREPFRLGAYFEDLVGHVVSRDADRCAQGLAVRIAGRTLGELDLLFAAGGVQHHWELAVKFYLFVPGMAPDPRECFVGPMVRDRLHKKVARLKEHQLALPHRAELASLLEPWLPLRSAAFVKGRLFYPAASEWTRAAAIADLAPEHERGWWCHVPALADELPDAAAYAWIDRRHWLAPIDAAHDPIDPMERNAFLRSADAMAGAWPPGEPRSRIAVGLDAGGNELHRGFVVCAGWPG